MSSTNGTLAGIVDQICSSAATCTDVVEQALRTIGQCNGNLQAFIAIDAVGAKKRAAALDALSQKEKQEKLLLGVPIAIKDNICTKGLATTCASRMLNSFVPPYSATVVSKLEQAGAIVVGKTNMDEFAMGSSTESSYFGITRNPADPERIPGGSSGGSAAAVGAGMVPVALGSDTGGSIRQPSSHCGVVGLKPTYGRISRYGLVAFASSLDQIGPIATDVRDIGRMLSVLAGPDGYDSTCAGKSFVDLPEFYNGHVRGLRIGLPKEYFGEGLSDAVRRPINAVVEKLRSAGAEIVAVALPNVQYAIATYYIVCTAEASSNLARYDGVKYGFRASEARTLLDMYQETRHQGFGAEVKRRIMLGTYVLSSGYYDAYYLKAAKVRTLIKKDFERAFDHCDVMLSPVTPTPAFKIGEKSSDPLQMYLTDIYTVSANLAGIPGMSVPCSAPGELPVGIQFMAPPWREDQLLRIGFATQTMVAQ